MDRAYRGTRLPRGGRDSPGRANPDDAGGEAHLRHKTRPALGTGARYPPCAATWSLGQPSEPRPN